LHDVRPGGRRGDGRGADGDAGGHALHRLSRRPPGAPDDGGKAGRALRRGAAPLPPLTPGRTGACPPPPGPGTRPRSQRGELSDPPATSPPPPPVCRSRPSRPSAPPQPSWAEKVGCGAVGIPLAFTLLKRDRGARDERRVDGDDPTPLCDALRRPDPGGGA